MGLDFEGVLQNRNGYSEANSIYGYNLTVLYYFFFFFDILSYALIAIYDGLFATTFFSLFHNMILYSGVRRTCKRPLDGQWPLQEAIHAIDGTPLYLIFSVSLFFSEKVLTMMNKRSQPVYCLERAYELRGHPPALCFFSHLHIPYGGIFLV